MRKMLQQTVRSAAANHVQAEKGVARLFVDCQLPYETDLLLLKPFCN